MFTAGSGTSYAAPRVAFSAAQILTRFPHASANLVRALIVGSAEIPQPAQERLQLLGVDATRAICGHGLVDLERAAFSDDARVTLYAEDESRPRPFCRLSHSNSRSVSSGKWGALHSRDAGV
ncbi:S8 family serine peptidase (plasmid) [Bradyrhizobium guangxiense]